MIRRVRGPMCLSPAGILLPSHRAFVSHVESLRPFS
jgi:hypothetical protein